jgi:S1-C subfamily serine protease
MRDDISKLLDDLAANRITEDGKRILAEAAMADQDVFDAILHEEMLKEAVAAPEFQKQLTESLAKKPSLVERALAIFKRPIAMPALATAGITAILAVGVFLAPQIRRGDHNENIETANLNLKWPSQPPLNPASLQTWGQKQTALPQVMPDFKETAQTLGAGENDPYAQWRLATVIVRSKEGWGSGAFISQDGWLITNYHVVAPAAQAAAVTGKEPATLDVVTAKIVDGRVKPQPSLPATLYKVDIVHDLALLKLVTLPADSKQVAFFPLATKVEDGEPCFVIGSQNNGPAWSVRSANVSQQFDYPNDLSQFAAGAASVKSNLDRTHATVIVTDARISGADSGGPLLNKKGELIGVTFATSANDTKGSVGWHISLNQIRTLVSSLPSQPEGVPFDVWTAGSPEAEMLRPEFADEDRDGRIDSLVYRYLAEADADAKDTARKLSAYTIFIDFSQRNSRATEMVDQVPHGLWGMENQGRFQFNVFITLRADEVSAIGYTNSQGVVEEIRIARPRQKTAFLIWSRRADGQWVAATPAAPTPMVDSARLGAKNMRSLEIMVSQFSTASSAKPR